ncbi:hypothetical protein [uncultured Rikenella sp.]|uniref:hypothetical protein n=1 Tax=uncultured Rikenella sp. TaxID=368003 RepID=UPI00262E1176|nr:hypothetical protein [uncultured Rikenella sp.]
MSSLPAPGYRNNRTGASGFVGSNGYMWQSAVRAFNGTNLGFSPSWLFSNGSDYRAYGFQLRCLSE